MRQVVNWSFYRLTRQDLNPIEKFWANLKGKSEVIFNKFCSLAMVIDHAFGGSFKF